MVNKFKIGEDRSHRVWLNLEGDYGISLYEKNLLRNENELVDLSNKEAAMLLKVLLHLRKQGRI